MWRSQVLTCLRRLSDTRPRLCTSAPIHLPVTASLSPWHTRQDLHFHTQKPPGRHSRARKLAKVHSVALRTSPYFQMFILLPDDRGAILFSLFSSPQVCQSFSLSLRYAFPLMLEVMNRVQKLHEGQMCSSRTARSAVDGTKYREDTNSFPWRTPVLSLSNHAAILLPEWGHFKHVLMQGIVQS